MIRKIRMKQNSFKSNQLSFNAMQQVDEFCLVAIRNSMHMLRCAMSHSTKFCFDSTSFDSHFSSFATFVCKCKIPLEFQKPENLNYAHHTISRGTHSSDCLLIVMGAIKAILYWKMHEMYTRIINEYLLLQPYKNSAHCLSMKHKYCFNYSNIFPCVLRSYLSDWGWKLNVNNFSTSIYRSESFPCSFYFNCVTWFTDFE